MPSHFLPGVLLFGRFLAGVCGVRVTGSEQEWLSSNSDDEQELQGNRAEEQIHDPHLPLPMFRAPSSVNFPAADSVTITCHPGALGFKVAEHTGQVLRAQDPGTGVQVGWWISKIARHYPYSHYRLTAFNESHHDFTLTFSKYKDHFSCSDLPLGWSDSKQRTCEDYHDHELCTSWGTEGPGWKKWWKRCKWWQFLCKKKTFHDFAHGGTIAPEACCHCGGGWDAGAVAEPTTTSLPARAGSASPAPANTTQSINGSTTTAATTAATATTTAAAVTTNTSSLAPTGESTQEPSSTATSTSSVTTTSTTSMTLTPTDDEVDAVTTTARTQVASTSSFAAQQPRCESWCEPMSSTSEKKCNREDHGCDLCQDCSIVEANATEPDASRVCRDSPTSWTDSTGNQCEVYKEKAWCTLPNLEDWADRKGISALGACCACGGGVYGPKDSARHVSASASLVAAFLATILCITA